MEFAITPAPAPEVDDGGAEPKPVASAGDKTFVATNDKTVELAWDSKTGKLTARTKGVFLGHIQSKITFVKAGVTYTCSATYGVLKAMPAKTPAQRSASMKMKIFNGKQFCLDKLTLDPKTLAPKGGLTPTNFKKIKTMTKSAKDLAQEKAALSALKGFTGLVQIDTVRYLAWPTTMSNVGGHTGKGSKIPINVRSTKVNLG
jgi:hypothetical protein